MPTTTPATLREIHAAGLLLTADAATRVLRYRLLPYGEAGRTNVGMVTASAGTLTLPDAAAMVLNIGHDRNKPVGRGVNLAEDEQGLTAAFMIARTTAGDDLLVEAADRLRPGISVEIADPVIRSGRLVAGRLEHAAAVTDPAFTSAVLVAAAADVGADPSETVPPDTGPSPSDAGPGQDRGDTPPPASDAAVGAALSHLDGDDATATANTNTDDEDETPDGAATEDDERNTMPPTAAAAPDLRASATRTLEVRTANDLFNLLARAHETHDPVLLAALADITQTAIGADITQAQWLGELWSGRAYARLIVPLFGHGDLTSFKVDGWRWVTKPTMDTWAGDKTAVPSNTPDTEPTTDLAARIAGAHDIDRIYRDFNVPGFWESYARAMTESYARKSDAKALTDALAAATPVAGGTVPDGVSVGMTAIVDGALAIIDTAIPSFAVVGKDLYRDVLLTRSDDTLAYLNASLGLEDGTVGQFSIVPSAATALAGKVLVGAKEAMTVHELGGVPIRAEGLDMVRGGVDVGFFGYLATVVHDDDALALVTPTVTP